MGESGAQNPQQPPMPDMKNMWSMLIVMIIIMGLYWVDASAVEGNNHLIGGILNAVFQVIDFGGQFPVVTLMLMGSIMILLSSGLRTLMTDMIEQRKAQEFNSAFQKELRQARMENNRYKLKKLTDMQPQIMAKTMESSNQMMKIMPYTMFIVVPIFLWVRYFVDVTVRAADNLFINIPWAMEGATGGIDLMATIGFIPAWVLVYSLVSIPLGQIIMRVVRYFQFKKRLKVVESGDIKEEVA